MMIIYKLTRDIIWITLISLIKTEKISILYIGIGILLGSLYIFIKQIRKTKIETGMYTLITSGYYSVFNICLISALIYATYYWDIEYIFLTTYLLNSVSIFLLFIANLKRLYMDILICRYVLIGLFILLIKAYTTSEFISTLFIFAIISAIYMCVIKLDITKKKKDSNKILTLSNLFAGLFFIIYAIKTNKLSRLNYESVVTILFISFIYILDMYSKSKGLPAIGMYKVIFIIVFGCGYIVGRISMGYILNGIISMFIFTLISLILILLIKRGGK